MTPPRPKRDLKNIYWAVVHLIICIVNAHAAFHDTGPYGAVVNGILAVILAALAAVNLHAYVAADAT